MGTRKRLSELTEQLTERRRFFDGEAERTRADEREAARDGEKAFALTLRLTRKKYELAREELDIVIEAIETILCKTKE